MSKSEYSIILDQILFELNDFYKGSGFRRKGHTYNRTLDFSIVHVINFQMGAYHFEQGYEIPGLRYNLYGRFTVNIGIFIPPVYKLDIGKDVPKFISELHCQIRQRIGHLLPIQRDCWWTLKAKPQIIATDMRNHFNKFVFPFLERFSSEDAIMSEWEKNKNFQFATCTPAPKVMLAFILFSQGKCSHAHLILHEEYTESKMPEYAQRIKNIAAQLGLDI
jgi:hypothetical protein